MLSLRAAPLALVLRTVRIAASASRTLVLRTILGRRPRLYVLNGLGRRSNMLRILGSAARR